MDGGERERQVWEKAAREVGMAERRVVDGGMRAEVVLDCMVGGELESAGEDEGRTKPWKPLTAALLIASSL